jgi:hypothetical protein
VRSIDDLKAAADHLAGPLGYKKEIETLHPILALPGLDRTRPTGVLVRWPARKDHPDLTDLVAFAPIFDEKQFLASCRLLGARVSAAGEHHQVEVPGGFRLFLRFARNHVYASGGPDALRTLPSPDWLSLPPGEKGLVVARVWPARARGLRNGFLWLIRQWQPLLESRNTYVASLIVLARQVALILQEQIRELNLRVELDRAAHDLNTKVVVVPNPDTELAHLCRYLGGARGRFTSMLNDAPLGAQLALPPFVLQDIFADLVLDDLLSDLGATLSPRSQKALLPLLEAGAPTVKLDGVNAAIVVHPDESFLFAVKVQQGRQLDLRVRDLYRATPARDRKTLKLSVNAERVGSARVHRLRLESGEVFQLAFRDDLIAAGKIATPYRKQFEDLLNARLTTDGRTGPFLRVEARGSLLAREEQFLTLFRKEAPGIDLASLYGRVRLEGGSSLELKVQMHSHLLTVFRLLPAVILPPSKPAPGGTRQPPPAASRRERRPPPTTLHDAHAGLSQRMPGTHPRP